MRRFLMALCAALSVICFSSTNAALVARDLDGNLATFEAYYDDVLDITWLADANYAQTSGYDADGQMTWSNAKAWVGSLNFGGITGWRLPRNIDQGGDGCNFGYSGTDCGWNVNTSTGEMASLYYDTLGNLGYYDTAGNIMQPGWGLINVGPFSNFQSYIYWSDTEMTTDNDFAWNFYSFEGQQSGHEKDAPFYAWAVHDGDIGVSAVPLPGSVWLLVSSLTGLIVCRIKSEPRQVSRV